jgi:hypothetical protein
LNLGRFLEQSTNKVTVSCLLLIAIALAVQAREGVRHGAVHGQRSAFVKVERCGTNKK